MCNSFSRYTHSNLVTVFHFSCINETGRETKGHTKPTLYRNEITNFRMLFLLSLERNRMFTNPNFTPQSTSNFRFHLFVWLLFQRVKMVWRKTSYWGRLRRANLIFLLRFLFLQNFIIGNNRQSANYIITFKIQNLIMKNVISKRTTSKLDESLMNRRAKLPLYWTSIIWGFLNWVYSRIEWRILISTLKGQKL